MSEWIPISQDGEEWIPIINDGSEWGTVIVDSQGRIIFYASSTVTRFYDNEFSIDKEREDTSYLNVSYNDDSAITQVYEDDSLLSLEEI
jgi:hypothetical protein